MKIQVVAAVIVRGETFLLGRRALSKKSAPGFWCPVSGKIEAGESQQDAVVREVFEEVGVQVQAVKKVGEFDTHDKTSCIHWWLVEIISGEPYLKNDEHTELRWFSIAEMEALSHVFREDIELYKSLIK